MGRLDAQLGRHQGCGDRRVDVAIDQYQIGTALLDHLLEGCHDPGGLYRVRRGPDPQIDVRCGQIELLEEYLRHVGIIVLARVDQSLLDAIMFGQATQHRGGLHKVGSGADDVENVHAILLSLERRSAQSVAGSPAVTRAPQQRS